MTKNIELWDDEANYHIWGVLTDDNKVELTTNGTVKIKGELQGNKFYLGQQNDSIWGFLNGDKIELWDNHLHHMSGELT